MDPMQKFSPGQDWEPNAQWLNAVTDLLNRTRDEQTLLSPVAIVAPRNDKIYVVNGAGQALDQFGVVGLGSLAITPTSNIAEWRNRILFNSASPSPSASFGILQGPIPNDSKSVAEIFIDGVSRCKISITTSTDGYAAPIAADYVKLLAQSAVGPARIIWHSAPSAWSGATAYVIGDMVSVAGTYYTCTANHTNHTPPNASYWSVGAVRWAFVEITNASAGGSGGITSINGDTTAAQVFTVGTSGTDFDIADTGAGTLKWNLPNASDSARGVVSTAAQMFVGSKCFVYGVYASDEGVLPASLTYYSFLSCTSSTASVAFHFDAAGALSQGDYTLRLDSAGFVIQSLSYGSDGISTELIPYGGSIGGSTVGGFYLLSDSPGGSARKSVFGVSDWSGAATTYHHGLWQTIAGIVFSGGLATGGAFSAPSSDITYTPTTSGDWNGAAPTTVRAAIDRCAALLKTLNGGTGP